MRIPFVGPTNTARSYSAAVERSINVYLEKNDDPNRPWVLYGTPGMTLRLTFGTSPVRGGIELSSSLAIFVAGNTVYKVDTSYTATSLGTIGTSSGRVGIASNGTEVIIVDGAKGWLATSTTLTEIIDADFPDGVTGAVCLDSFFIVFGDGTQKVYWNETPGSGTAWNGLDFGSAEGRADPVVGGVVEGRNLWLHGTQTTELWRNTGDADSPFQRMDGVFIEQGTVSGWSVAKLDNGVLWLARSEDGDGLVLKSNGSAPVRISTHTLETAMRGYSVVSDAFAWCYQLDGHAFYVLTFPTANATWMYDAATQQWTEWLWWKEADNTFNRHRASCHVFFNRKHLVGDWESGKLYSLEPEVYKDASDTIKRLRRTQTLRLSAGRLFFGELDVEMETAVANADCSDPQLMMRYSNDDGNSWSSERIKAIGAAGEYGTRVKFGPSGATKTGKGRVWELSITDPVKFALFGADVAVIE